VVVKFVRTYNAQAHRHLAGAGLAPSLRCAGPEGDDASRYGGRRMVVMDYIDGKPLEGSLTKQQFEGIERAITLLHSRDLVLGDFRSPNILIKDGNVTIVDFGWCDKAGEARYPANLIVDSKIC
jgi:Ser/Thr protein kinase RdoA (MazF antagonist)